MRVLSQASCMKTVYLEGKNYITSEMIKKEVLDYTNRTFYLSGPNGMVESYEKLIRSLGIQKRQIVTDYFPGFWILPIDVVIVDIQK